MITRTVQSVTVSDGIFNVLSGSATVDSVPQSIFNGPNVRITQGAAIFTDRGALVC